MSLWDSTHFAALLTALALDAAFGEPAWLYRRVPHPVVAIGRAITWLDQHFNRTEWRDTRRRFGGTLALVVLLIPLVAAAWFVAKGLDGVPGGWFLEGALASALIAQRSLHIHVAAVAQGLDAGGLTGGRQAAAMLVGRNPETLDAHGVCRAAIESCAENFSDGVVAPVFWYALLGLPGLLAYKAINTADSMIGHRNTMYRAFGWAAARIDDLVNLAPARLAGLMIALATLKEGRAGAALTAMWRDAAGHRSVNAGWPEAAMAGGLGLALAGPRTYGREVVCDAWMGQGGRVEATADDVRRSLAVLRRCCAMLWVMAVAALVYALAA
jgi:adenosylcobinamide-phosphate synthase